MAMPVNASLSVVIFMSVFGMSTCLLFLFCFFCQRHSRQSPNFETLHNSSSRRSSTVPRTQNANTDTPQIVSSVTIVNITTQAMAPPPNYDTIIRDKNTPPPLFLNPNHSDLPTYEEAVSSPVHCPSNV